MATLYSSDFIRKLPDNESSLLNLILQKIINHAEHDVGNFYLEYADELEETYALLEALHESAKIRLVIPPLPDESQERPQKIWNYIVNLNRQIESVLTKEKYQRTKHEFILKLNDEFCFDFSQGDIDTIKSLIAKLKYRYGCFMLRAVATTAI